MKLTQLLNQSPSVESPPSDELLTPRGSRVVTLKKTSAPSPGNATTTTNEHVDGLITPLSCDLSPSLKLENLSYVEQLLTDMSQSDLTRSSVEKKLLGYSWSVVELLLDTFDFPELLTRAEMELIVRTWHTSSHIDMSAIAEECFARSPEVLNNVVSLLEANYGSKRDALLTAELIAFEVCNLETRYHVDDVIERLPGYTFERFRKIVSSHYPHRLRWTYKELDCITEAVKSGQPADEAQLLRALPFRRKCEIKAKYIAIAKKIPADLITVPEVKPIVEEPKPVVHEYEEFIRSDLSVYGLRKAITSERTLLKIISIIEEEIQQRGGSSQIPFTDPEKDIVRNSLEDELPSEEFRWQLPFRTQEEIDAQVRKIQSACIRQKKFSNDIERLIYEAEWYSSMAENEVAPGGRRRRVRRSSVEFDSLRNEAVNGIKKIKVQEEPEKEEERKRLNEIRTQKRVETIRKKKEKLEELRKKKGARTKCSTSLRHLRSFKKRPNQVASLIEEAKYFQSITGDGKCVQEGDKRKRVPTYHLIPEFQDRQRLKSAQKKIEEEKIRSGRTRTGSETLCIEESDTDEVDKLKKVLEEDLSDDEEISPFDPPDIGRDTKVELQGREIFNDSISSGCLFPFYTSFSGDVTAMMRPGPELPLNNIVGSKVIKDNLKSYKPLPNSFPPLYITTSDGEVVCNPDNMIHIRYLLFPRHTEQFVLARPKSNELDPVYEIMKVFQIHYALYFSYSESLKEVIFNEYCLTIQDAVDNDDFAAFMTVVDKWNSLMLELTPYPIDVNPSIDINESLRSYLPDDHSLKASFNELKLQLFYQEVIVAGEDLPMEPEKSVAASIERRISQTLVSPKISSKVPPGNNLSELPEVYVSSFRHLRPIFYAKCFINLLNRISNISRFGVQQLLLKTYSRIVSPESRGLRSYKAFSAEVYGELLPCFVSEVLTKVGLKPTQRFYDLGSGVGNTTLQAALEFGACESGGCEIMKHASYLSLMQESFLQKQLLVLGLRKLNISFALSQSFVDNMEVREKCVNSDVLIVNNYLFDFQLNVAVGKLLYGLKPGSKIISLKNFIPPRYKACDEKTIFDYLKVEKFAMSDYFSVSWTANKVPYYISTVQEEVLEEYK